jgi:hypothetical protein
VARGAYLSPTEGGAYRFEAQFLIEDVRSGGEQRSQLIGEEAGAAGAVDLEPVVQLFDPIFYVAASAVDRFLQVLGRSFEVRDHALEVLALEEGEDLGRREAAIEPHPKPCTRERGAQLRQQAREDPHRPDRRRDVAGTQHVGEQVLLRLRC